MASWLKRKNWLHETSNQELQRRVRALEASVQSVHDRINELDERFGAHITPQPRATEGDVILSWGDRPISASEAVMLNRSRGYNDLRRDTRL